MGLFGKKPLNANSLLEKALRAHPEAHDFQASPTNTFTFKTGEDLLGIHTCEVSDFGDTCVTHSGLRRQCRELLADALAYPGNGRQ